MDHARLIADHDEHFEPGETKTISARARGLEAGLESPHFVLNEETLNALGLEAVDAGIHNPTSERFPVTLRLKPDRDAITLKSRTVLAIEAPLEEEEYVLMAAALDAPETPTTNPIRPIGEGGEEDLAKLGFTLDKAIDPDDRRADGSYAPLPAEKRRQLYEIARRWYLVWSTDAKAPRISYLVVLDIPVGDNKPIQQRPYPIPAKLRAAAMDEVNKLLKSGLIEPSMSDWASPTLVRVKKDSTAENPKVKLAIDYRRVNACCDLDAGGLGTQSDILYGVGGRYKFIGLCDAAGGYYQFLLNPSHKHRSAFILPASMGGTLFQWRVAV